MHENPPKNPPRADIMPACDHWNVVNVRVGKPFKAQDLTCHYLGGASMKTAERLVDDLKQVERQHIAFLKPAHYDVSC